MLQGWVVIESDGQAAAIRMYREEEPLIGRRSAHQSNLPSGSVSIDKEKVYPMIRQKEVIDAMVTIQGGNINDL